jgi:4-amino-4-deoxy-L-arabinose transferase-like glycosyltransferase
MTLQVRTALIAAAIVLGGALLYLRSLDYVPPYLIHDEAQGALQAHSIATTGHDLSGRLLPMYFTEPEFPPGRDPALIYWTAIGLELLPFTEAGVRTPTVLVAVLNIALMFFAARALFRSTWAGVLAAILLALSPVHFIRGRLVLSPLYSIPFVLAWLWSLARFSEQPTSRRLIGACTWLALGMYSYLAAVLMMPLYLLMTIGVAARPLRWRGVALGGVTMAIGLLPMAAWYLTHPERNAQIVSAYQLSAGAGGSMVAGVSAVLSKYIHLYWAFFDPAYFFVTGDPSLVNSTRQSGLFPLAFVVLVPVGLVALARSRQPLMWVLVGGFFAAPIVSVISGAIEMNRVMFAIPFTILVASGGVLAIWERPALAAKAAVIVLLMATAWQFSVFERGYMSESYRMAAAPWFSGSVREALRALISRSGDSQIYISQEIEWVHRMWRFYAIEAGRLDLLDRTTYFKELPASVASNAKLICPAESPGCSAVAASAAWRQVLSVPSIDGGHRYLIFERVPAGQQSN